MKEFIGKFKTNENNVRTNTLIAAAVSVATVGAALYLHNRAQVPTATLVLVEDAVETITDATEK